MIRYHLFDRYEVSAREKFVGVLFAIVAAVSVVFLLIGAFVNSVFVMIVGLMMGIYSIIILAWLFIRELPKIDSGKYGYYDVWFEHHASTYGMKIYNKNSNILKYE